MIETWTTITKITPKGTATISYRVIGDLANFNISTTYYFTDVLLELHNLNLVTLETLRNYHLTWPIVGSKFIKKYTYSNIFSYLYKKLKGLPLEKSVEVNYNIYGHYSIAFDQEIKTCTSFKGFCSIPITEQQIKKLQVLSLPQTKLVKCLYE